MAKSHCFRKSDLRFYSTQSGIIHDFIEENAYLIIIKSSF